MEILGASKTSPVLSTGARRVSRAAETTSSGHSADPAVRAVALWSAPSSRERVVFAQAWSLHRQILFSIGVVRCAGVWSIASMLLRCALDRKLGESPHLALYAHQVRASCVSLQHLRACFIA